MPLLTQSRTVGLRQILLARLVLLVAGVLVLVSALLIGLGIRPLMASAAESAFSDAANRVMASLQGLTTTTTRILLAGQTWWHRHPPRGGRPDGVQHLLFALVASRPPGHVHGGGHGGRQRLDAAATR
jgi:hypothetical protein